MKTAAIVPAILTCRHVPRPDDRLIAGLPLVPGPSVSPEATVTFDAVDDRTGLPCDAVAVFDAETRRYAVCGNNRTRHVRDDAKDFPPGDRECMVLFARNPEPGPRGPIGEPP